MKHDLDSAVTDYLTSLRTQGKSQSTVRSNRIILGQFLASCGQNIQLKSISDSHIDAYLERAQMKRTPNSMGNVYATLNSFFRWARNTTPRRVPAGFNPMGNRTAPKPVKHERRRVPVYDFRRLLEAPTHPRDRMVVALGLYTGLRGGEIRTIRLGDVDLDLGEMRVIIHKSKKEDTLVIVSELDEELRRYLKYYTEEQGTLDPSWYLVPAKTGALARYNPETRLLEHDPTIQGRLRPTRPIGPIGPIAQRGLKAIGWMTDEDKGEGGHTLRRSGARAFYEELREEHADAKNIVKELLHHESVRTTEGYIGAESGRERRNDVMRGRMMYSHGAAGNVVPLKRSAANGDGHGDNSGV